MDVEIMMSQIVDNLIMIKNNDGAVYLPEWNFNGIGDIDFHYGYQIKTNTNDILELCGLQKIPEENPITLSEGWNLIAYLRDTSAPLEFALETINSDDIIIVKDYNGSPYLPEYNFNGIGQMVSGQGYQIKISEEATLTYPANGSCYSETDESCDINNPIEIGDEIHGGIVFYIDSNGQHGLVASKYDVNPNAMLWGCVWEEINGAEGEELGTGLQNSLDIQAGCNDENIAAKECLSYSFNNFDDWYLPSIDELELMRNTVGQGSDYGNIMELNNSWYWSSTEVDLQFAKRLNASTGLILNDSKGNYNKVRPIRSF